MTRLRTVVEIAYYFARCLVAIALMNFALGGM